MNAANDSIESDVRNYKLLTIIFTAIHTNEHVYTSLINILSEGRVYQHLIEKIKHPMRNSEELYHSHYNVKDLMKSLV